MKNCLAFLSLVAALIFSPSLASPALAQATAACAPSAGVQPGNMLVGGVDSSHCYWALVDSTGALKTTTGGGVAPAPYTPTAVAGTQRGVSMVTATALTIPATSTTALISVGGTNNASGICAYWQDDGTSPTGSAGNPLASGAYLPYNATGLPIKLIQATGATCTFNAAYYK